MIRGFPKAQRVTNPVASAKKILGWYCQNRSAIPASKAMLIQGIQDLRDFTRRVQWLERRPDKTRKDKENLLKWQRMLRSAVFDASVGMNKLKLSK